jgi:multidrug resistance efflux pump
MLRQRLLLAVALYCLSQSNAAKAGTTLSGKVSKTAIPESQPTIFDLEMARLHTVAVRDIGMLESKLQHAQQNLDRVEQLVAEGIAAQKEIEDAEAEYKEYRIQLLARQVLLQQDEAAIRRKNNRPTPAPPQLDMHQIDAVLEEEVPGYRHPQGNIPSSYPESEP